LGRGRAIVYSSVGEKIGEWDMVHPSVSISGWSGITSHPTDPTSTVIATFYDKEVRIFDTDRMVRHWKCVQHPTQISFLPEKNLLAVLEYNQITLWDLRNRAPTQRLTTTSSEPLYGISCLPHVIGVGGASRILSIFDTATWKTRNHWKNCVKYEISTVNFSQTNSNYCYVSDDSVIVCDDWTTPNKNTRFYFTGGIRLDSAVLGVSQDVHSDNVAALTENGTITVISNGIAMAKEKRTGVKVSDADFATTGSGSLQGQELHKKKKQKT